MADPVTWFMVASTALSAGSAYKQGKAADQMAEYEAAQIDANAERVAAAGIKRAEEQRRQKRIALSDARAAQASAGGSTTDAGALDQLGRIGSIFEYNAMEELYGASLDQQGLYNQVAARRTEGGIARRSGTMSALSTILSSAGSIYGSRTNVPKDLGYTAKPSRLPAGTRSPSLNVRTELLSRPPAIRR